MQLATNALANAFAAVSTPSTPSTPSSTTSPVAPPSAMKLAIVALADAFAAAQYSSTPSTPSTPSSTTSLAAPPSADAQSLSAPSTPSAQLAPDAVAYQAIAQAASDVVEASHAVVSSPSGEAHDALHKTSVELANNVLNLDDSSQHASSLHSALAHSLPPEPSAAVRALKAAEIAARREFTRLSCLQHDDGAGVFDLAFYRERARQRVCDAATAVVAALEAEAEDAPLQSTPAGIAPDELDLGINVDGEIDDAIMRTRDELDEMIAVEQIASLNLQQGNLRDHFSDDDANDPGAGMDARLNNNANDPVADDDARLVDDDDDSMDDDDDDEQVVHETENERKLREAKERDMIDAQKLHTAFDGAFGRMTLTGYLEQNPDLHGHVDFIYPFRSHFLGLANPFTIYPAMFDTKYGSEALIDQQKRVNKENNNQALFGLGLQDADFGSDTRFWNGEVWNANDVHQLSSRMRRDDQRKQVKEQRDREKQQRKEEEKQRKAEEKRRKAEAANAAREARRQQKIEKGIMRDAKKRAMTEEELRAKRQRVAEETVMSRKERKKAQEALQKDDLTNPMFASKVRNGPLRHADSEQFVEYEEVPLSVRQALLWFMMRKLFKGWHKESKEMHFTNCGYGGGRDEVVYDGDVRTKVKRSTWQVQHGSTSNGTYKFYGRYNSALLAGLVRSAVAIDPRLDNKQRIYSWIHWLIAGGDAHAERWLRDPVVHEGLLYQQGVKIPRTRVENPPGYVDPELQKQIEALPHTPPLPMYEPDGTTTTSLENLMGLPAEALGGVLDEMMAGGLEPTEAVVAESYDPALPMPLPANVVEATDELSGVQNYVARNGNTRETAQQMRDWGMDAATVLNGGVDLEYLIDIYDLYELAEAGVEPEALLDANVTLAELVPVYGEAELNVQGYDVYNL
jgi:hypothetical protein